MQKYKTSTFKYQIAGLALIAIPMHTLAYNHNNLADTSKVYDLDEVFVTAQPKDQYRLRRQSLSSSMFSGADLEKLNINSLSGLSNFAPNFVMPEYGSRYTSSIYVRGIGSRVNAPVVGLYVDGMPILHKSAFNTQLYDIERVDILRGPQGTLYGMNTEGGLIRLYTRNPLNYQGFEVSTNIGTHGYTAYKTSLYSKLNDKLGFMLSGFHTNFKGFYKNHILNTRADKSQEEGGRMKWVWTPSERWDIQLLADYQHTHQNGFPYGELDPNNGLTAQTATNRQGTYQRDMVNSGLNILFRGNFFDFHSTTSYQFLKDKLLMDVDYLPADFLYVEQKQLQNAFAQEFTLKSNTPGRWKWTLGSFLSLGWSRTDAPVHMEKDMDAFLGNNIQRAMYNAMLQAFAKRMTASGMPYEQALTAAAAAIQKAGGVSLETDLQTIPGLFHTPVHNLGFFHESSFELSNRLTASLGLRFDYSHVALKYQTSATMISQANVMGAKATQQLSTALNDSRHNDFNQLLPKFGLNYRLDKLGSNLYATVSKGYRAGGYNIQMFSDILSTMLQQNSTQRGDYVIPVTAQDYDNIAKTVAYAPETSWNYEIGTHLNLFDNSLHMDLAAFYMQVNNQQLSQMAGNYGFGRKMTNAGKSFSYGVEATLRGNALDNHLQYMVSYGLTHAEFKNYSDTISSRGTATVIDYKGKRVPFIPEHTIASTVDYTLDINRSWLKSVTLGVNANAQGATWWDEANTIKQDLYAVLGAHLTFSNKYGTLNIWANNLTQTHYNTFAVESAATGKSHWFAQPGNPFQMGVELKIHL